jgi:hypothetical protein
MPSGTTSPPRSSGGGTADLVSFNSSYECRDNPDNVGDMPLEWVEPSRPVLQALIINHPGIIIFNKGDSILFDKLKREQDLAKAVKSNDAKFPMHLWDMAICGGEPLVTQQKALLVLRTVFLGIYRQRLWSKMRQLMRSKFGRIG